MKNIPVKTFIKTTVFSTLVVSSFLYSVRDLNFFMASPFAHEGEPDKGDADGRFTACGAAAAAYTHGALQFFNGQICRINVMFPGIAEEFLNKLITKMNLDPDVEALPSDGTMEAFDPKTVLTKEITGGAQKVVAPDTFAGTYDYKATIEVDGVTASVLYWSGTGETTKGAFIHAGKGFGRTKKELLYIKWDRTTADQYVGVLGARIADGSTFAANGQTDAAIFGEASFNATTKVMTVQATEIGQARGASSSSTTPACWLMYGVGVKDGEVDMAKTQDSDNATGTNIASTDQDGTGMDSAQNLADSATTANGTGNVSNTAGMTVALKYSCADLNGADGAGEPFDGDTVNFDITKTAFDAIFATN